MVSFLHIQPPQTATTFAKPPIHSNKIDYFPDLAFLVEEKLYSATTYLSMKKCNS